MEIQQIFVHQFVLSLVAWFELDAGPRPRENR